MKPDRGYCINCDNRHGCKTKTPPCIEAMEERGVTGMSGKKYLLDTGRIGLCAECPFLRTCFSASEYARYLVNLDK